MIPFGPQLIGQTEKALDALLKKILAGRALTPDDWVTLQLTARHDGTTSLPRFVEDRAHLGNAGDLVAALEHRGLIAGNRLTDEARLVVAEISAVIAELTDPVWRSLDSDDIAATERVLNTVLEEIRNKLALDSQ